MSGAVWTGGAGNDTHQATAPGLHEALGGDDSITGTGGVHGNDTLLGGEGLPEHLDDQSKRDLPTFESVGAREAARESTLPVTNRGLAAAAEFIPRQLRMLIRALGEAARRQEQTNGHRAIQPLASPERQFRRMDPVRRRRDA